MNTIVTNDRDDTESRGSRVDPGVRYVRESSVNCRRRLACLPSISSRQLHALLFWRRVATRRSKIFKRLRLLATQPADGARARVTRCCFFEPEDEFALWGSRVPDDTIVKHVRSTGSRRDDTHISSARAPSFPTRAVGPDAPVLPHVRTVTLRISRRA